MAHPRVSGENDTILTGGEGVQGSSPRERGKLHPAIGGSCHQLAHPRVSGENLWGGPQRLRALGSSPRERGKREHTIRIW